MPEAPFDKAKPHPFRRLPTDTPLPARHAAPVEYAELAVTTNYTFLTGASHPEEMVESAVNLGHAGAAISDTNTLAGIVRAHVLAKEAGIPLAIGSRLLLSDPAGRSLIVYPTCRDAYSRLCRLLTLGKRRAPKGECHLTLDDVIEHQEGLLAILPPAELDERALSLLKRLREVFDDDRLSLAVSRTYEPGDEERLRECAAFAAKARVPLVAINDAHYHIPERRALQDVLTCIRHGCTIEQAGLKLHANAERHLKPPDEMARLFDQYPKAIARTIQIAQRAAAFSLDQLNYEYPAEPCPDGLTPSQYLERCTWEGATRRYPLGIKSHVARQIRDELAIIAELRFEAFFLTCYDIITFARSKGILCQGRGGAANSAVCFCLGITEVDPESGHLLFARFVSRSRGEPPDIDIDFEHERREEVIQYIYTKYGRERAALTAEVITYRGRSAVRDVGKAMGLSLDCVDNLAKTLELWFGKPSEDRFREAGVNPEDPTMRLVMRLTSELIGFPRHLSQHVGGFVITRSKLHDLVPIENAAMEDRTVIEWDKDDIDAVGMLKVDVLGLGMLTCIRKAFEIVKAAGGPDLSIPRIMSECAEDPRVYEMIQHADTLGVFQIESRAQMSMLPRLKPACFYDLVIEVAIVRPGPIQGKMVHPYLKRRNGEDPVTFPSEAVKEVLGRTLGVPLFQEQAMQLCMVAAGFSDDEANRLRKAMAAWKRKGRVMEEFARKIIEGMTSRGYPMEFAECCVEQIKGFSEYGFPESHAASFAILVYVSCWLKRYHPAAFAAALINSQPMGFYGPAQIVRDAKEHGVEVRPIDVNHSRWDCTLEPRPDAKSGLPTGDPSTWGHHGPALRLGMRQAKGLAEDDANKIAEAVRQAGRFDSVDALWRASGVSVRSLRCLAKADAFASMGLDRQAALWQIRPLRDEPLPLFVQSAADEPVPDGLPPVTLRSRMLHDYSATGLSLRAHPMLFLRQEMNRRGVIPHADLRSPVLCPQNRKLSVAGVVLVRQRPGTASGVVFITLEDETGIANLIIWPTTFERFRRVGRMSTLLLARGHVERQGEVVHVHVDTMESLDELTPELEASSRDFH